jgi:hypothetical protein
MGISGKITDHHGGKDGCHPWSTVSAWCYRSLQDLSMKACTAWWSSECKAGLSLKSFCKVAFDMVVVKRKRGCTFDRSNGPLFHFPKRLNHPEHSTSTLRMALLGSAKINEKPGVACGFQALFRSSVQILKTVTVAVEPQLQEGKSERVRFNGQCSEPLHVSHIYICRHSQIQERWVASPQVNY